MMEANIAAQKIKPTGIYAYVDKATVWLKQPLSLSTAEGARLESQCDGGIDLRFNGELVTVGKRVVKVSFPDPSYRQRVQLYQPKPQALATLDRRNDAHLTYVEFSLDWIFDSAMARDDAFDFVCLHHVKKHHRDHGIRIINKKGVTRYTGPRSAPNVLAIYQGRASKVTGEIYCVHFDWRIKGCAALRRTGFGGVVDVLRADHRLFWKQRLLLYAVVPEHLGRQYNNYYKHTKRRGPWIIVDRGGLTCNMDARTGSTLIDVHKSTQAVVDEFGKLFNVRRSLSPICVKHLLPTPSQAS